MSEIRVDFSSNEDSAVMQALSGGSVKKGVTVGLGH